MPQKQKRTTAPRNTKPIVSRTDTWRTLMRKKIVFWPLVSVLGFTALSYLIIALNPILFPPIPKYNFGVSFSARQSEHLGLDWQENFTALLDDLEIRNYRLMSYWNEVEAERGTFDFSRLDWQMDEAAKRGATISLAIGQRQPRWPECHDPEWSKQLGGHEWKQALYAYIEIVVKRYEHHPALHSWQLENEYHNGWFGECTPGERERLDEEYALVKKISKKPIWLSLADQHGIPIGSPAPDAYGYSVYRYVYNYHVVPGYVWYPTPVWYHKLRAQTIKSLHPDSGLFVHELQLEPWGAVDTKYLSIPEQNKTMDAAKLRKNVTFARQIGFTDIYGWGAEWWYWRKTAAQDPTVWEAVKAEVQDSKN